MKALVVVKLIMSILWAVARTSLSVVALPLFVAFMCLGGAKPPKRHILCTYRYMQ